MYLLNRYFAVQIEPRTPLYNLGKRVLDKTYNTVGHVIYILQMMTLSSEKFSNS